MGITGAGAGKSNKRKTKQQQRVAGKTKGQAQGGEEGPAADVVVGTPLKVMEWATEHHVNLASVKTLVIDEADLVLSFGYAQEVQNLLSGLTQRCQALLFSATLSEELEQLKRVALHNPAIVRLNEGSQPVNIAEFFVRLPNKDRFLLLYVFLKLGVLRGKGLVFVNSVDTCYRLKLFLEQFKIPAAVLNAELPINSRLHILEEFNRGIFDLLIATDTSVEFGEAENDDTESSSDEDDEDDDEEAEREADEEEEDDDDEDDGDDEGDRKENGNSRARAGRLDRSAAGDDDQDEGEEDDDDGFGVSRGLDFKDVSFVINFDFPKTATAYTHRIGRTARGLAESGTALSLVDAKNPKENATLERVHAARSSTPANTNVESAQGLTSDMVTDPTQKLLRPAPLDFNHAELERFRYRVQDVFRSVTRTAVKELRAAEIKREILHSKQLKDYFAEHPNDLRVLRHDRSSRHPMRNLQHLAQVPDYLLPPEMRRQLGIKGPSYRRKRHHRSRVPGAGAGAGPGASKRMRKDPLLAADASAVSSSSSTATSTVTPATATTAEEAGAAAAPGSAAPADPATDAGIPEELLGFESATGAPDHDQGGAPEPQEDRVYYSSKNFGPSTSNRRKWQEKHRKGKFAPARKGKHRQRR